MRIITELDFLDQRSIFMVFNFLSRQMKMAVFQKSVWNEKP